MSSNIILPRNARKFEKVKKKEWKFLALIPGFHKQTRFFDTQYLLFIEVL